MRRYQLTPRQKETKFTIDDLKIYDREDNELVVNVEFEYDWIDREVINLYATDVATGEYVDVTGKQFYKNQINELMHECHERVANRSETFNF